MLTTEINKVVVIGWDNFSASLVEGIKKHNPECTILCTAPEAQSSEFISSLPNQKYLIYENVDYIIISKNTSDVYQTISEFFPMLSYDTYIIDFYPVKTPIFDKITDLLDNKATYVSCFVFLDEDPCDFTVRANIFQDKIIAVISDGSNRTLQNIRNFWSIFQSKIVPTSADFFDEILSVTNQSISLLSHLYTHMMHEDSWADTLFFGFYNKDLRNFLTPTCTKSQYSAENIVANGDNIQRTLSFIKREIDQISQMIEEKDILKLSQYLATSQHFKNKL